jgi:hypothetical protein
MSARSLFILGPLSLAVASAVAAEGRGLSVDAERIGWPALQARLFVGTETLTPSLAQFDGAASRPRSAALFGDYYVSKPYFGNTGGLRLTSGLVMGPRGAVLGPGQAAAPGLFSMSSMSRGAQLSWSGADANGGDGTQTWPYLGVGYSGSSLRGGWGFSADLGLAAQSLGVLRGRALTSQSLDYTLRELRLTPVFQLGVSYRF